MKLVQKIEQVRQLPQFIFINSIRHSSVIKVREEIITFLENNSEVKEIDFILESPGGSADHAYVIIRTLRENFEKVNIVVPFWAKSAATLLALGGSTIIMDEFGEFGPLDVQLSRDDELPDSEPQSGLIDEYSLSTIENRAIALYQRMLQKLLRKDQSTRDIDVRIKKTVLSDQLLHYIANLYRPLFERIDPYQIGEKARSLAIAEKYSERILLQYNKQNLKVPKETFIDYMVHECPNHGYNIDYSMMNLFLANVIRSVDISKEYHNALGELSSMFSSNLGVFSYVGFFNKKLLEKQAKKQDTITSKETAKKRRTKNEHKETQKQP